MARLNSPQTMPALEPKCRKKGVRLTPLAAMIAWTVVASYPSRSKRPSAVSSTNPERRSAVFRAAGCLSFIEARGGMGFASPPTSPLRCGGCSLGSPSSRRLSSRQSGASFHVAIQVRVLTAHAGRRAIDRAKRPPRCSRSYSICQDQAGLTRAKEKQMKFSVPGIRMTTGSGRSASSGRDIGWAQRCPTSHFGSVCRTAGCTAGCPALPCRLN
jgi:hypothetical protein